MPEIKIKSWTHEIPNDGIAVIFDIFRCSTTIQCLINNKNAHSVWIAPSLEIAREPINMHEYAVFSELRKTVHCKERYDNSPDAALNLRSRLKTLVATTSGTPAMFAAKACQEVLVGSLVGFSSLLEYLQKAKTNIYLIPAAKPDVNHVEDLLVAEAMANALTGASNCAEEAKTKILASGRIEQLMQKISTGAKDCEIALSIDRFRSVPSVHFQSDFASIISL